MNMRPHADQWKYPDDIYLSKARALVRVMKSYQDMKTINKLDQRFVNFVYCHTAVTQEIMDLVGNDTARVWVPFILTELAQPSLPYEV